MTNEAASPWREVVVLHCARFMVVVLTIQAGRRRSLELRQVSFAHQPWADILLK
jgi:hypothetical protein